MDSQSTLLILSLACLLQSGYFVQSTPHGKAMISVRMASQICRQAELFANSNKLQPSLNASVNISPERSHEKPCKAVRWNDCHLSGSSCSKFEFTSCSKKNIKAPVNMKNLEPRILGGQPASEGEIPYQVAIRKRKSDRGYGCGAVIINHDYLLTAAHCIADSGLTAGDVNLWAGVLNRSGQGEHAQNIRVSRIYYDNYDPKGTKNDIALLELTKPIVFNEFVQPAIIAPEDYVPVPSQAVASGWGETVFNRSGFSPILLKTTLNIITRGECVLAWRPDAFDEEIQEEMLCTKTFGRNICRGDSGGPLTQPLDGEPRCRMLIGTTSFMHDCTYTNVDNYAVFMMVSKYKRWIQSTINPYLNINRRTQKTRTLPRISGGDNADPKKYPFLARLAKDGKTICGGVILNIFFVLTAAACVFGALPGSIVVEVAYKGQLKQNETGIRRDVALVIVHEDFDMISRKHNIAIVRLATALDFSQEVQKAELAAVSFGIPPTMTFIGWGYVANTDTEQTKVLQAIPQTIVNFDVCWQSFYQCALYGQRVSVLCAERSGTTDGICPGDEGGPLIATASDNSLVVVAIASFRPSCVQKIPGIFTKVSSYRNWISSKIPVENELSVLGVLPNELPFHVLIRRDGQAHCSGIILNAYTILTVASCFENTMANVRVFTGKLLLNEREDNEHEAVMELITLHENYESRTINNNIALIQLERPLPLDRATQPLILPSSDLDLSNITKGILSGYGIAKDNPTKLFRTTYPILSKEECVQAYNLTSQELTDNNLCTSPRPKICVGDRGSPLTNKFKIGFTECYLLVGIVAKEQGCTTNTLPSIFTKVDRYRKWIQSKINLRLQTRNLVQPRIHGGISPGPQADEFPFMVRILRGDRVICGGTIVNEYFILTSAICINDEPVHFLRIMAGKYKVDQQGPLEQVNNVSYIFPHENFDKVSYANDIALIRLQTPLRFTKAVKAVVLPNFDSDPDLTNPALLGWGQTQEGGRYPNTLQKILLKVEDGPCIESYGCSYIFLGKKALCAADFGDKSNGPCAGDHGGPVIQPQRRGGDPIIVGISSYRIGCARTHHPAVLTRVSYYSNWIKRRIVIDNSRVATQYELPYQVLIRIKGESKCSGALINSKHVLTSASCFPDGNRTRPSDVDVYAGKYRLNFNSQELAEASHKAKNITIHESYNASFYLNNIAIVHVGQHFPLGVNVQFALLPPPDVPPLRHGFVSGWGLAKPPRAPAIAELQKVDLNFINHRRCRDAFARARLYAPVDAVCTETLPGNNNCLGDHGTPLTQKLFDEVNCFRLVGILSQPQDCTTSGLPNVYMKVSSHTNWILKHIDAHSALDTKRRRRSLSNSTTDSQLKPRISGGSPPRVNEFPFQVRIMKNKQLICGGAIVNDRFVVTSAFCVVGSNYTALSVILGDDRDIKNVQIHSINYILPHEEFNILTHANDVALLELDKVINFTNSVKPVVIPPPSYQYPANGILSGYGKENDFIIAPSGPLRRLQLKIFNETKCKENYYCAWQPLINKSFCADVSEAFSQGLCDGDIGDPFTEPIRNGSHILLGIGSFRIGCLSGRFPSVFTKVSYYSDWIQKNSAFLGIVDSTNALPYQVTMFRKGMPVCIGTIINAFYIITSLHCFPNLKKIPIEEFYVVAGGGFSDDQQRNISNFIYDDRADYIHRSKDIIVVKVDSPFRFNHYLQPALLPRQDAPIPRYGVVGGLVEGKVPTDGPYYRYKTIPILSRDECPYYPFKNATEVRDKTVCIVSPQCIIEHGSPISERISNRCHRVLAISMYSCNKTKVGSYDPKTSSPFTVVAKYSTWIQSKMRSEALSDFRRRVKITPRIVGGEDASPNEFPFQARITERGVTICSGAILSHEFVITSAICISNKRMESIRVIAGDHLINVTEPTEQNRYLIDIIVHEDFDAASRANNIAILHLDSPLILNDKIAKGVLPSSEYPTGDLWVTGWGRASLDSTPLTNVLQKISLRVKSLDDCTESYGCALNALKGRYICANSRREGGTCNYDLGDPISRKNINTGIHVIYGVASFRIGCLDNEFPAVFTYLWSYNEWILGAITGGRGVVAPGLLSYHVLITIQGILSCSGALIGPSYVLTTAGCFHDPERVDPKHVKVIAGKFHVQQKNEIGEVSRDVAKITYDRFFKPDTLENDIALVELSAAFDVDRHIKPAILPPFNFTAGGRGILSGWDLNRESEVGTNRLRREFHPIITDTACRRAYAGKGIVTFISAMMCTETDSPRGCFGDTGSPFTQGLGDGCYVLIGILSQARDCFVTRYPSVYTEVSNYVPWINQSVSRGNPLRNVDPYLGCKFELRPILRP